MRICSINRSIDNICR